jgi:hypothetical protein
MELRSTKTVTPLLVLGYNRPDKLIQLLKSIGSNPPEVLVVALDGPKNNDTPDELKVAQCIEHVKSENWAPTVVTLFRTEHLGLRRAVTNAVTWTMNEYGRAIIVEDDIILGPQFLEYMTYMLDRHEKDIDVAQINGYNEVPHSFFTPLTSASRYSKYPTSCAWATWKSRWERYDDSLTWGKAASIKNLSVQVGSIIGAIKWKINFNDAAKFRVDSWAVRWISTIWANNWVTVYPNRNLVFHDGRTGGTHTRTQPKWKELQVTHLHKSFWLKEALSLRSTSESNYWLQTKVFHETIIGIFMGIFFTSILKLGKLLKSDF